MSAKKAKVKATGYDIGCRVVMALAAISVPIAAYFADLIYYVIESPVFKLLAQYSGNENDDGENSAEKNEKKVFINIENESTVKN